MEASFVPFKTKFYATVKNGIQETIVERAGKKMEFDSAAFAVAEALREIRRIEAETKPRPVHTLPKASSDAVEAWREERARRRMEDHIRGTLIGIKVVRVGKKKARRSGP